MLQKIFKWGGLIVSIIGVALLAVGAMDTRPLGSGQVYMQIGALFFIGGIIINLLVVIAERLRTMTHILSDLETSFSMHQEEPALHMPNFPLDKTSDLEETQKEAVRIPQPTMTSLSTPPLMPDFDNVSVKEAFKPRVFVPAPAPKPSYFPEPPPIKEDTKQDVFDILDQQPITIPPLERVKENDNRLSQIAKDFPELDAILNRNKAPEPIPEPEPIVVPPVSIIREGVISGIAFRLFSDGTIEADFANGRHRFAGINEFRSYVENS